jgi:pimeloyl-ACP methyl ester carboxylesterase
MLKAAVNGIELAYERRGGGAPLVLIHGYPLDHTIWEPVASLLENDFDLILPDLRGFGQSASPRTPYLLADLAADLAALLDHLGIERAALAGHSMGGYVALAFARAYPRRLLGLGLVASQSVADPPDKKAARHAMAGRVEADGVGEVAGSMPALLTANAALQSRIELLILRQTPAGVAAALRAMAERQDSTPLLPGFEFPVVIVHGLADQIMPIERAREVKVAVQNGHLLELDGAGHVPMMEAPEATAKALKILQ